MSQDSISLTKKGDASEALNVLGDDAETSAQRIVEAFTLASEAISETLQSAAQSGSMSFSDMAETILQDLARIALELVVLQPLNTVVNQLGDSFSLSIGDVIGQRQSGGPVIAGAPYLVGEKGPEIFVPPGSGAVTPAGPSQVINVTIQAHGDTVEAVQRSERQITAAIARAAAAGGRLL